MYPQNFNVMTFITENVGKHYSLLKITTLVLELLLMILKWSIQLRIALFLDEPSKPGNVEIVDWDAGRVDIKWSPPESDGGAPITSYIVEYKDKFSGEWTTGPVSY